jgi:hypothetical protein
MTIDMINDFICTPFMPYLVVTFTLHTPALVYAIRALDNAGCPELFSWLLVNAALSILHMIAALHIVNQIRNDSALSSSWNFVDATTTAAPTATAAAVTGLAPSSSSKMEEGKATTATATPYTLHSNFSPLHENSNSDNTNMGDPYTFNRIKHVLCYDTGMALYILVIIVWVVWLGIGVTRRFVFDDGNEVCDELVGYLNITIICGYMWATLVAFAFCCSLLCLNR